MADARDRWKAEQLRSRASRFRGLATISPIPAIAGSLHRLAGLLNRLARKLDDRPGTPRAGSQHRRPG
jgi:hypothetical protein